ncbi:MAG: hypothetical protein GY851_36010 [bacterium]|nr:hypothetical protein [bacterium]
MKKKDKKLFAPGPQRTFTGAQLGMISFPLGGIGTGSVGLSGRGGLVDWEIFNRPNVGSTFPRTFPIIWAREQGEAPVCRVLQAPALPPYQGGGHGHPCQSGEGLPHMDSAKFHGEYPFAEIDFKSRALPVKVSLQAYNPFIPSNPDDSGFPTAVLEYSVTNPGKTPVDVCLAWSLLNMIGSIGDAEGDPAMREGIEFGFGKNLNAPIDEDGLRGLVFSSKKWRKGHPRSGSMALTTPNRNVTVLTHWLREGWYDAMHDFWDTFSAKGRFPNRSYGLSEDGQTDAGALGIRAKLKPGQTKVFTFYFTWHFPNFEKYWGTAPCCDSPSCKGSAKHAVWKNYYAKQFSDAFDVAKQLHEREADLRTQTLRFHHALFSSTLPPAVLDAVSSQMAILKTATCVRLTDGTFYGFEGCSSTSGCCEGSCTHVWNYQQTLPFLFPSLERSMRTADYRYNMREDGGMCFRLQLPLGSAPNDFHACADGQMGGVMKTYRDWMISGDDAWLKSIWPSVKRALEYAWVQWDADRDGVMEGIQHNTYDIEFHGPNPMMASFYLGALTAGAELADAMGDDEAAARYREVCAKGRQWVDAKLFNGEFYVQKYDPKEAPKYQFGEGCLSDQVLGQWIASVAGLGHVLDPDNVGKTLKSVFKYNWHSSLTSHANAQRVYALNDEAGLLLCSWPNGGRPAIPFVYSDEVWTGIEYQVASHLILEGMVREGLTIVQAARDRHDGIRRNPWNEYECGSHYARAMAAYGLVLALSGFSYDKGAGRIGFAPAVPRKKFRVFWALDGAWGRFVQKAGESVLKCDYGAISIRELHLPGWVEAGAVQATAYGRAFEAAADEDGLIRFEERVDLRIGQSLRISR